MLAPHEEARFHTRSGLLTATLGTDGIVLDFPATPDEAIDAPPRLTEALGVTPAYVGKSPFDYLVEVDSEHTVRELRPGMALLKTYGVRGIIVTSRATTPGYDFVSRFFAPGVGIDEDPVTGSAHCCLGPYWSQRMGKSEFRAYQASDRGGAIGVRVAGDRVFLSGKAVTVLRGELIDDQAARRQQVSRGE